MKRKFLTPILGLVLVLLVSCNDDDNQTDTNTLAGEWRITAISNSDSPLGPVLEPEAGEEISIQFLRNGVFTGSTSRNEFSGDSSVSSNELAVSALLTTEVAETIFGDAFYGAMYDSGNTNSGLSVFNMIIIDDDNINLEYNDFKFMSIERK
ncbi:MAG: hypothetical protein AAF090_09440 [Bacteroidota bacterium]